MTTRRNIATSVTAILAAFAAVGCSADGASTAGAGSATTSDTVTYHADYPEYSSLDEVIEESDVVVEGSVVGSRVERVLPDASAGDDPATNPQAGLSPAEAAEAEKAAETDPVVVTVSTVKVSRTLAGEVAVGDTIEVSQLGGTYRGVTYEEEDTTVLAEGGTRYVLMLADHGGGEPYDLVNPEQALYTVGPDDTVRSVSGGFGDAGGVDQLAHRTVRITGNRTR